MIACFGICSSANSQSFNASTGLYGQALNRIAGDIDTPPFHYVVLKIVLTIKSNLDGYKGCYTVSGKGQVHRDGFPRQRLAINGYAAQHSIKIVQFFEEKGVTGTKDLVDRPALSALMVALHADGVKVVLVEALHRLARDLMVQESLIADFKRHGFTIISVAEPDLCSDDPSRKLMRQIMGSFFEYEKSMIVIKLRGARQRMKARTGHCEGAKPYGHYAGEQAVLDRIRASHAAGQPFLRIAAMLNVEGVKPRRGTRWHAWSVNKILSRAA